MAGIYLHIPYCRQACHYCNFHFSTLLKGKNDFIPALLREMEGRKDYIGDSTIASVYLGGGTPSLLEPALLTAILDRLQEVFVLEPQAEITMEANPDDMANPVTVNAWHRAGINRLSIGIQSFYEEDLQWMNRAHTAKQATECIRTAKGEGFDNLSIDLIYGSPTLPDDHWRDNVERAIAFEVAHLSCYALTVEPRPAVEKLLRHHKRQDMSPEDHARQFLLLMDWMGRRRVMNTMRSPISRSRGIVAGTIRPIGRGETYLGLEAFRPFVDDGMVQAMEYFSITHCISNHY